ncbi:hypothetical protein BDZ97DRAFT_1752066 [Flammula alnicola]|nr:hypothetical protein BDZ97DRAFT_1752066 [Flammula alnicola]
MSLGRLQHLILLTFVLIGGFYILMDLGMTVNPLSLYPINFDIQVLPTSYSQRSNGSRVETDDRLEALTNGVTTKRFRDNLRNDTSYITSWSNAGLTNQFMSYVNMIYLSTLTDRIPIIPPFAPDHHISASAGIIPFGDIFDLDSLRNQMRTPILEWRDVKELPSGSSEPYSTSEVEDLGCWTTRPESEGEPIRAENVVHHLGVDVSYTRVPVRTRLQPWDREELHVVLPQLAAVTYPRNPIVNAEDLNTLAPSPRGHFLRPDQHLTCFDTLYYATSGTKPFEWQFTWSPAWRTIGRYLTFTYGMKELGRDYLLRMFQTEGLSEEVPPFIAVHIRRGDFSAFCSHSDRSHDDCFPPVSAYDKRVKEVQSDLISVHKLPVWNVVVTSDETSPSFWADVRKQGWSYVNHTEEKTLERYGEWYPPLIDMVMQSYALGFVGTEDSTFSLVARRRIEDWNGGVAKDVNVQKGY